MRDLQPKPTAFSVWKVRHTVSVPTEADKKAKPHFYLIVSPGTATKHGEGIFTCVPISTDWVNMFSVPIPRNFDHDSFLKHDSHCYCDILVSFFAANLEEYRGEITNKDLQRRIKDRIMQYLGLDE